MSKRCGTRGSKWGEIVRFGIVGGVATTFQIMVYYPLSFVVSHSLSLFVSYVISLLVNYFLTIHFTFRVESNAKRSAGFLMCHIINFTLQFLLVNVFVKTGMDKQFAIIPVLAICVPVNYLLVRRVITLPEAHS